MVEDIDDPVEGFHYHIDMIYFCRLVGPPGPLREGWMWVGEDRLADGAPLSLEDAPSVPPPEDVRLLALKAIEALTGL